MARAEHPRRDHQAHHEQREARRTPMIAAAAADVVARQPERAGRHREGEQKQAEPDEARAALRLLYGPGLPRPRTHDLKERCPAAIARCLHAKADAGSSRQRAFPCFPLVGVRVWYPQRRRGLKRLDVKSRRVEKPRPVHHVRRRAAVVHLRRHHRELRQAAFRVEKQRRHVRHGHRWIAERRRPLRSHRLQCARTRPIPVPQGRKCAVRQRIPSRRGLIGPQHVLDVVLQHEEPVGGGDGTLGVAEFHQDVAGAILERVHAFLQRNVRDEQHAIRERRRRQQTHDDRRQQRQGHRGAERARLARRRHHFRRRRFSRGEGCGERVAARQRGRNRDRRRGPQRGVMFDTPQDDAFDRRIEIADHRRRVGDRAALVERQQLVERLRFEDALAREHLEEHEAEGVDVGLHRGASARELFRRHVLRRAGARRGGVAIDDREAKIRDADVAVAVDHHVGRLEIAMEHPAFVRGRDAGAQLPRDLDRLVLRQPADPPQQRGQIFTVHILHRQKPAAVVVAEIIETADVLVRHLAGNSQLGVKLREAIRIGADAGGQKFERDRLIERQVVGSVDFAHAAPAEQRDETVAAGNDGAWREWQRRGRRARTRRPRGGSRRRDRQVVEVVVARSGHAGILTSGGAVWLKIDAAS